jgi:hypothetical protein
MRQICRESRGARGSYRIASESSRSDVVISYSAFCAPRSPGTKRTALMVACSDSLLRFWVFLFHYWYCFQRCQPPALIWQLQAADRKFKHRHSDSWHIRLWCPCPHRYRPTAGSAHDSSRFQASSRSNSQVSSIWDFYRRGFPGTAVARRGLKGIPTHHRQG